MTASLFAVDRPCSRPSNHDPCCLLLPFEQTIVQDKELEEEDDCLPLATGGTIIVPLLLS